MKKTLAIAAGLLLATATSSAFAQPYYGERQSFRAPSSYAESIRQMRACQRYARLHGDFRLANWCSRHMRWNGSRYGSGYPRGGYGGYGDSYGGYNNQYDYNYGR